LEGAGLALADLALQGGALGLAQLRVEVQALEAVSPLALLLGPGVVDNGSGVVIMVVVKSSVE
jgi:hypothetical protein